ncbi:hypothetical protein CYG49_01745 [Candidatus Saccharibacteria bacterium]|nr:MAG: hypothetical protein CYG49_01745 [Candidatus Saccharibacteria bacterium]
MTYVPGATGASKIATSGDVALNNPDTGHVLAYDASVQKWKNATQVGPYSLPSPWPIDARASVGKQGVARPNAAIVNWLVDAGQTQPSNFNNGTTQPAVYPGDWLSEEAVATVV